MAEVVGAVEEVEVIMVVVPPQLPVDHVVHWVTKLVTKDATPKQEAL